MFAYINDAHEAQEVTNTVKNMKHLQTSDVLLPDFQKTFDEEEALKVNNEESVLLFKEVLRIIAYIKDALHDRIINLKDAKFSSHLESTTVEGRLLNLENYKRSIQSSIALQELSAEKNMKYKDTIEKDFAQLPEETGISTLSNTTEYFRELVRTNTEDFFLKKLARKSESTASQEYAKALILEEMAFHDVYFANKWNNPVINFESKEYAFYAKVSDIVIVRIFSQMRAIRAKTEYGKKNSIFVHRQSPAQIQKIVEECGIDFKLYVLLYTLLSEITSLFTKSGTIARADKPRYDFMTHRIIAECRQVLTYEGKTPFLEKCFPEA